MFERWLSPLLASVLGHYVKGLQREQLQVGLWNGVLRLDNVELRLEARTRHSIVRTGIATDIMRPVQAAPAPVWWIHAYRPRIAVTRRPDVFSGIGEPGAALHGHVWHRGALGVAGKGLKSHCFWQGHKLHQFDMLL